MREGDSEHDGVERPVRGAVGPSPEALVALHEVVLELSLCSGEDEICLRAVELGRSRLGFDRVGIWFRDDEPGWMRGTFGVDESGHARDERHSRVPYPPDGPTGIVFGQTQRYVIKHETVLHNNDAVDVGWGEGGAAAVWDGTYVVGVLYYDNLLTARAYGDADHEIAALYAAALGHVLARHRALLALAEREENLRAFFDSVDDFLLILDQGARIVHVNPVVVRRLGYSEEELLGQPVAMVHPAERGDETAFVVAQLVAGSRDTSGIPLVTKWGEQIPVETKVTRGHWNGQPAIFGVARDITERVEAERQRLDMERQLLHTQKLESLGVLAGGIAHDFNNLLAAILGNLELARAQSGLGSSISRFIENAEQAVDRAVALTRQMLAYSGRASPAVERVDLSLLVRGIADLLAASTKHTAVLHQDLADGLPPILADVGQVQQVAMNLLVNASEALHQEGGEIWLRTGVRDCDDTVLASSRLEDRPAPGRFVFLEVADNGCGMDDDTRARLFDPFFTTKFTGRGLGLAAVLGIVRSHRGALLVESEPGHGSVLTVLFPPADGAELPVEAEQRRPSSAAARGPGAVLVVDDDESVRALCVEMVQSLGLTAVTAAEGEEGVAAVREHGDGVACVLLDLTMPKMSGADTLREMRALRKDLPVIVMSGYSAEETAERFAASGVAAFLEKPFALAELRRAVGAALSSAPRPDAP